MPNCDDLMNYSYECNPMNRDEIRKVFEEIGIKPSEGITDYRNTDYLFTFTCNETQFKDFSKNQLVKKTRIFNITENVRPFNNRTKTYQYQCVIWDKNDIQQIFEEIDVKPSGGTSDFSPHDYLFTFTCNKYQFKKFSDHPLVKNYRICNITDNNRPFKFKEQSLYKLDFKFLYFDDDKKNKEECICNGEENEEEQTEEEEEEEEKIKGSGLSYDIIYRRNFFRDCNV